MLYKNPRYGFIKTKPSCLKSSYLMSAFLAGLLLTLFMISCQKEAEVNPKTTRPVKTTRVHTAIKNPRLSLPAKVRAHRRVELAFKEVSGPLMELPIEGREGRKVKKGALLARIDPTSYRIRLRNVQGLLKEAEAALSLAKQEYQRIQNTKRRDAGAVSAVDIDRKREELNAAKGRIRALKAEVADAQNKLDHTQLTAPFTGWVAKRMVDNFQEIQPTQPILALEDISQIELLIDVPENVMATAKEGEGEISFAARFPALPKKRFPLTLKEFATRADPATQTYQVVLEMAQPKAFHVITGMTATVTVTFNGQTASHQPTRVPAIAVVADPNGAGYVWVVDPPTMTVHKRKVKVGAVAGSKDVNILEGLHGGEEIVVAGLLKLREGMRVKLWKEE
jgi:multidrug efflux system membrane fusion protein